MNLVLLNVQVALFCVVLLTLGYGVRHERRTKKLQQALLDELRPQLGQQRWFRINVSRQPFFERRIKLVGYESKGLLTPERVGSTRVFRRRDRARLILILRGKRLGFSLRDISDYLGLYDADRTQRAQVNLLVDMVDERTRLLEQQLADLQTTLGELREIRKLATERLAQAG